MATQRPRGDSLELKAYAGTDPATGRRQYLYDRVPASAGKREVDRACRALDARAHALSAARRDRRRDPGGSAPSAPGPARSRTVGDAVEAWWKHHGAKLAGAPKTRPLIDGIILPYLGDLKIALVAGTPPDDPDERDPDVTYLAERWEEIALTARRTGDEPLAPSTIHKCHGIVGAALRRAGRPIVDPGLPSIEERESTTPLAEELAGFLPHLSGARTTGGYTTSRRVRGTDKTVSYTVPARDVEPSAMDLMTEAFALLVASGPRPVEAAALTRSQVDTATGRCSLEGRGVVLTLRPDGSEQWVIAVGETAKRRRRVITLDDRALRALKRWFTFQQEYALALGARPGARALVFSLAAEATDPVSPKVFSKAFERAVVRARAAGCDLPDGFHLYDMRHFGITQLLRAGRDVAAVAKRFGTSPRMIHTRYAHAIPTDDARLADTLGAIWGTESDTGVVIPLRSS